MRKFQGIMLATAVLVPLSAGLAVPASAAITAPAMRVSAASAEVSHAVRPNRVLAPFPTCGDHFTLTRSGSNVRIVGVDLKAFSSGYMLVWPAANGDGFGPYKASPNGGANFSINTGSSSQTTISISLTTDSETDPVTLCASDYYA